MSTSAMIVVKGATHSGLYKHWDGYPESTLPWLTKFAENFSKERGHDPAYCLAQLIRSSVSLADEFELDPSTDTGWGVMVPSKTCYEYKYTIDSGKGTVTVKKA